MATYSCSSALWESSVLPYILPVVRYKAFIGTCAAYLGKLVGLAALSVLTTGSPHTKPPPYDCFQFVWGLPAAPRTPKVSSR
jgi:hypothetical protein